MENDQEKIKAIIVDDEVEGIHTLAFMLAAYCPEVRVIGKYESSIEGLKAIKRNAPDLLFLDIQMPHMNGLELLELAGPNQFHAIFTTAYDDYQLQALRLNALDYLIKPVDHEELQQAVARVKSSGRHRVDREQITNALDYLQKLQVEGNTKVGIKEGNRILFVNLNDISHCRSDGNFTFVYLADGRRIYSSYPLGKLEEILPNQYFFRPHREYLINREHIAEYDKSEGGFIVMENGDNVPISRSRKEDLLEFIRKYLNNDRI